MGIFYRTFLRVFAFLSSIVFFILCLGLINNLIENNNSNNYFEFSKNLNSTNKIGLIKINGPILNEPSIDLDIGFLNSINVIYVNEIENLLKKFKNEKINGLIISINSPGGSVSASYKLYEIFKNFSQKNSISIYFHTNELLASGGYWAALSGNKIFASYGSLIGSIGVRGPDWIYYDKPISISNGLFGNSIETKNGIKKFNNIAGKSKDLFDYFRAPTNEELTSLQNTTKRIYSDFVLLVSKNRKIESNIITDEIGAMIFETKSAKEKFLIDEIANLNQVIDIMAEDLLLEDYKLIKKRHKKNTFYNFFQTSYFTNKKEINNKSINQIINRDICNISKYSLSTIMLNTKFDSSC
ncbi:MAG: putative signal peptide peptidase SppA [Alphaproteobacteria bacterium MarineAlpha5_Bin8]|nr:MAG: putative signal peptide peptidase SppA [Alphaproteobacteria bacterium MarineAlpha5_Bin7]PPR46286.1 MAG: putative signal peptide peptidase SppA [Alphaproteobacteria bacterium MarineAlpha5_Bin8]PPR54239.1 MAG: putative signal peptide peptidase SppA [Alphaproteobacteria bacterium MarineAlpha5_Bin6]|tara:strand:- start:203 stop:1267 length:1065 start_codon:yes stop_codon:yes gene_type:complete